MAMGGAAVGIETAQDNVGGGQVLDQDTEVRMGLVRGAFDHDGRDWHLSLNEGSGRCNPVPG